MKGIIKTGVTLISLVVALIPLWIFIGGKSLLSPEGFFQNFFVFGIGIWFLGGIQLLLLIICFVWMFIVWTK